jgi:1-acyl-sn-glycerol-3-phosphate acyltransferase
MRVARSLLYLLVLIVITPFYWVITMLSAPLPRLTRWRIIAGWPRFAAWLAGPLLGITFVVNGRQNIPTEPCMIFSKHSSAWETLAFSGIFPPHIYVLKRELLWIPFLGWGLALFSPIAINRSNRRQAMQRLTEQGVVRFRQGFSIMIFPEGTRVPIGRRAPWRGGGAALACSLDAKVLPVAHDAGCFWPRNALVKTPGRITVSIGSPIDTRGMSADAVMRQVETWVESEVERITGITARRS